MTMREQFLQIVEKYDIDEVWVNFDEALDRHHVDDGETYIIYKKDGHLGQKELLYANYDIMATFAPTLRTADIEDPIESDSIHLSYMIVPGLSEKRVASFERMKKDGFRLLYSKGDGLVG